MPIDKDPIPKSPVCVRFSPKFHLFFLDTVKNVSWKSCSHGRRSAHFHSFRENSFCVWWVDKKLNSTKQGAFFRHFWVSKVITTAQADRVVSFSIFFQKSLKLKNIEWRWPTMTKIESKWGVMPKGTKTIFNCQKEQESRLRSMPIGGNCLPWTQPHWMGRPLLWTNVHLVSTKSPLWRKTQFSLLLALALKVRWFLSDTVTVLLVKGSNIPPFDRTFIPVQIGISCWAHPLIPLVMQSYWCRFWGIANRPPGSWPHSRRQTKLSMRLLKKIKLISGLTQVWAAEMGRIIKKIKVQFLYMFGTCTWYQQYICMRIIQPSLSTTPLLSHCRQRWQCTDAPAAVPIQIEVERTKHQNHSTTMSPLREVLALCVQAFSSFPLPHDLNWLRWAPQRTAASKCCFRTFRISGGGLFDWQSGSLVMQNTSNDEVMQNVAICFSFQALAKCQ